MVGDKNRGCFKSMIEYLNKNIASYKNEFIRVC